MKELNLLKGLLKNRSNITIPILGLFLITGSIGYGINISEDFTNEEIVMNNDGNAINVIVDGLNITNTGTIKGNTLKNPGAGNGISNAYKAENILGNIRNTGVIQGMAGSEQNLINDGAGNGILNYGTNKSSIGDISNYGIISGSTKKGDTLSGNGIVNFTLGDNASINNILNYGVIKGVALLKDITPSNPMEDLGNGIINKSLAPNDLTSINETSNYGIISGIYENNGNSSLTSGYAGNGAIISSDKTTDVLKNAGVISGYSDSVTSGNGQGVLCYILNATNTGVIKGTLRAIQGGDLSLINNGLLAGRLEIFGTVYTNNGVDIILNSAGDVEKITNGGAGIVDGKEILNGNISGNDSSISASSLVGFNNLIINGVGTNKGALIIDKDTVLENSIVNGYNTSTYVEAGKTFTATNTIFNGGGLKNDVAVIKGDTGDNTLDILGTSIINGAVDLGDGNDNLTIANEVQINGALAGGLGNDILNLGKLPITRATTNLNILNDISGFENINTNGDITIFETANITGANNITLESGNLILRVDPTVVASGKVTGHALYGNNGILTSTGGNLVIGLNGLGEGAIISMGGTTIVPSQDNNNDLWWKDGNFILTTNSLVLDGKLSADGKDINISVLESIPLDPSVPIPPVDPPIVVDSFLYKKLNKVYQSIVTAGEIGELANTTSLENKTYNESLEGLLVILDQIYANNPYAYTLKSSRDSLKLFEDNMSYLTIKPKQDEMIVQGKAIYTGVRNDSSASGSNNYGFDAGHRNYKTTTNTVGGLATFEYGLSDKTSIGFVFGGNNQDVKFKGSSKIKGNSLYLGTFAKTDINNFKFMSGVGYQYTSADADRKISNKYDSFSTGDKYDINSLNAFVEAKYVYNIEQDWTLEPKVRLSYYYIDQDKVNEGYTPGQVSMRTDKADSNTADIEVGVDFIKSLYLNNGKLKNILSLGVINTIGDKSEELNGYILGREKDGKKFDIQGVELPKTSGKVSYNLELEQTNGMIYTAGVSLEFAKDYNRNVNATVGMGYKF